MIDVDTLDDDELTAQALASDPSLELDDDAVCLWDLTESDADHMLPEGYMPSPMPGALCRRKAHGSSRNCAMRCFAI